MNMNNHLWYTELYKYIPLQNNVHFFFQKFSPKKGNMYSIVINHKLKLNFFIIRTVLIFEKI